MRRRFTSNMDTSKETPLFIEALEDGVSFSVHYTSGVLQYCVDDGGYSSLSSDTFSETINAGSRFYIKGDHCYLQIYYPRFTIKGKCKIGGNVHSAVFGDIYSTITSSGRCSFMFTRCDIVEVENDFLKYTTLTDSCYESMFRGCTSLQIAPELPATQLADSCYNSMFYGCTSLAIAPSLPATALADSCYNSMFYGCTSLAIAPSLPATALAERCYQYMFRGCTSLQIAPELPATTLADYCYGSMFQGCINLTTAPELSATTLANYCYHSMFQGCTSLQTAPELPATTLANYCYHSMFHGCSKLNYIKMLATDISANNCLFVWVLDVASSGTFVKNAAMTSLRTGDSGIPSGWTVENA